MRRRDENSEVKKTTAFILRKPPPPFEISSILACSQRRPLPSLPLSQSPLTQPELLRPPTHLSKIVTVAIVIPPPHRCHLRQPQMSLRSLSNFTAFDSIVIATFHRRPRKGLQTLTASDREKEKGQKGCEFES